jgi:hypothetical protein
MVEGSSWTKATKVKKPEIKYAGTEESIICFVGNEKDLLVSEWTLEEQDFGLWPTNEDGFTEMLYSC